jgi:hypothetical protein
MKKLKSNKVIEKAKSEVEVPIIEKVKEEEPSWYHYLVVICVLIAIGFAIYGILFVVNSFKAENDGPRTYLHTYKVGEATYNIYYNEPLSELERKTYSIEMNKRDLWLISNLTFSFGEYNGTDNGRVAVASTKLANFMKAVYSMRFDASNFQKINVSNCNTSSIKNSVIIFDPYSNESGVFLNRSNGCILVQSTTPKEMMSVVDKWILTLMTEE